MINARKSSLPFVVKPTSVILFQLVFWAEKKLRHCNSTKYQRSFYLRLKLWTPKREKSAFAPTSWFFGSGSRFSTEKVPFQCPYCRGIITAKPQAKLSTPHGITAHAWGLTLCVPPFPNGQPAKLNTVYVQYFTGLLFVRTCRVCLRHNTFY